MSDESRSTTQETRTWAIEKAISIYPPDGANAQEIIRAADAFAQYVTSGQVQP